MERLQPILKQKFWILLGIGIVMTIVGWWMATGTMAATITSRTADIKAAEGKIPKGEIPNSDWSTGLATVNTQQELAVKSASRILWERQRARMTWPDDVTEFAWKMGYRGETIDIIGRENYRSSYNNDAIRVWETVRPFNRVDGSGIVDFSLAKFPRLRWQAPPLSAAMWDAQEDLWLLEALLQTITEVNGGATSTRQDACIHVIEKLTLHGGQPAGQRTTPTAGGGTAGGGAMPEMPAGGNFGGGNFGGGGGGGNTATVSADFDVTEEFGSEGGSGGQGAGSMMSMPTGPGGPGTTTAASVKRYIDDDPALPFKTRGFYMTLIMDHRKIPNLVAELSASERSAWPIEIVRVQYVRLHDDDTEAGGMGAGYNPGALGSEPPSGGQGSFGESPFGSTPSTTPSFSIDGSTAGAGAGATQSQAAIAAWTTAVQDPNMARVAICGIITLYKEVKPEAAPAAPTSPPQPPATPAPTEDNSTTPPVKPAEETAPDSNTDTATDAKPSAPAEGEPAAPGSNPSPSNEATPKKDETPSVPPAAKPSESP